VAIFWCLCGDNKKGEKRGKGKERRKREEEEEKRGKGSAKDSS
jgi:hypothetical protein